MLLPPAWLSLLRVPLAACFVVFVNHPRAALAVLAPAGVSDMVDGWLARHYQMVTATGAALDPITDKVFVLTVAVALVASRHLAPSTVLLLSTRELGEILLMAWLAARRAPHLKVWLIVTAVAGAFAAFSYWRRALHVSVARPRSET